MASEEEGVEDCPTLLQMRKSVVRGQPPEGCEKGEAG